MLVKERQSRIQSLIQAEGAVTTSGLMELFQVSVETVRRDLLVMEQNGLLTRVHGGAIANSEMIPFHDLAHRNLEFSAQKQELSRFAMDFVREGDYLAVDAGSTAICFAEALKERFNHLTVVTCSLDVFELLRNHRDFEVILCGGAYMREENAFVGSLTLRMLDSLHVQKAFIFPSAVSLEFGICGYQPEFQLIQEKLIQISDSVLILADSSKFEKKALLKLDSMRPEYNYLTDSLLPAELKKLYSENQIHIYNGGPETHE